MQPLAFPIYLRRKIFVKRHWGFLQAQLTNRIANVTFCGLRMQRATWTQGSRGSLGAPLHVDSAQTLRNANIPHVDTFTMFLSYEITPAFCAVCLPSLHQERGEKWETKGWEQTRPWHSLYRCLGPWQSQYQLQPTYGGL